MFPRIVLCLALLAGVTLSAGLAPAASDDLPGAVVSHPGGTFAEKLAAREVRRYVYLRTGRLLPIVNKLEAAPPGGVILVTFACKMRREYFGLAEHPELRRLSDIPLVSDQYALKTVEHQGRPLLVLAGGYPAGPLYAAYRLAEHLGVRFYLHGDVIPDEQIKLIMPQLDETGKPLFDRRGIQPFHDFPEGPDWWSADGYKAILGQLPKLRMNFFGLHTYPQGGVGPEPATWIGTAADVKADGTVKTSYPSRHFTTGNPTGAWGYKPIKTGDYSFGAAAIFDRDDYGADYMRGTAPWNKMSPEQSNQLFNRFGRLLDDTFTFARNLGIKTCLGTETPLVIPAAVRERLEAAGKDPQDPAVVQEVYEGIFRRIMKTHPLDYYWFWTPEGWTWRPVKDDQIKATLADLHAAIAAARKVKAPFTLATCGWVLGPQQDRALFDNSLPKQMPMSCINRNVGHDPVEPGFAKVAGRPKWAIPWLEDDPAMTIPQLWVGRMRKDAADAHQYGCTGLLGIHWRTRILGPNVAALARAAWDQTGRGQQPGGTVSAAPPPDASPEERRRAYDPGRHLPKADFYADWALSQFGPQAAKPIAELFARIDGKLPRPSTWVGGPGGIRPDPRPWAEAQEEYAFVDELAELESKVIGAGNRERFGYWLNNFRYLRAVGQVNCTWSRLNRAIKKVEAEKDSQAQKKLARDAALPIRKELIAQLAEVHRYLLATVTTPGAMGNVANWQQHVMPMLLGPSEKQLTQILGEDLPPDAMPRVSYSGEGHLFVPVVRTGLVDGESLNLQAMVLGTHPREVTLYWRSIGSGDFAKLALKHVARGVYALTLPADQIPGDLEYYIQATFGVATNVDGSHIEGTLRFPATAPDLNQTVVVVPAEPRVDPTGDATGRDLRDPHQRIGETPLGRRQRPLP